MGSKSSGRRAKTLTKKPRLIRRVMPNGTVGFSGVSDVARWYGYTPSAISAILRGVPGRGGKLKRLLMKEYPKMFAV